MWREVFQTDPESKKKSSYHLVLKRIKVKGTVLVCNVAERTT